MLWGLGTSSMPSECAKVCDPCLNYVLSNIVTLCSAGTHIHELIPVGEQLRGMTYNLLTTYLIRTDKLIFFIVYIEIADLYTKKKAK